MWAGWTDSSTPQDTRVASALSARVNESRGSSWACSRRPAAPEAAKAAATSSTAASPMAWIAAS